MTIKNPKFLTLVGSSLALPLSGCLIGTDLLQEHVSGSYYFWAFEGANQTQFIEESGGATMASAQPITIVDAPVTRAGWDSKWVLIEQDKRKYYIFDLPEGELKGPYTQAQFNRQRTRLGVPTGLDFTKDYSDKSIQ